MEAPKLFISYSWSNPSHEQWVLDLASELRESGVDVILDKWDLKEGYDAVAFMEKMVTDPQIRKVVIVSDDIYAAKADGRAGGVGTETQIISKEVYENQEQDKFVAVVAQKNEVGKPYLLWLKKNRTKKSGNYPTPSLPSLVIVLSGLRQKKEKVVNSSSLLFSFRPTASFITSQ
jgi:hypothetical protein